jgi:hypothetical protein
MRRLTAIAVTLVAATSAMAQAPSRPAESFDELGLAMHAPTAEEFLEVRLVPEKPLYLFIRGPIRVLRLDRDTDLAVGFAADMVEIVGRKRTGVNGTILVGGDDGRRIEVRVRAARRGEDPSPEYLGLR